MKNIAVVAGGDAGEFEVSLMSAEMVLKNISTRKYQPYLVVIKPGNWHVKIGKKEYPIDKNDFSFTYRRKKIRFDCAYIIVHGTPGEDGKLQGYFDMIEMPYTSPSVLVSSLTMNKYLSKIICKEAGMKVAESVLIRDTDKVIDIDEIVKRLKLPCFVKPNNGGSSVATNKAYTKQDIINGIEEALKVDSEVILEEYLKGKEVTCTVYNNGKEIQAFPVTEIVPHNDFFDYEAKYQGKSDEITPARISEKLTRKIQELSIATYQIFNTRGMVRVDFILKGQQAYFMEVNTVPGFSHASITPQQIRAAGIKESKVISQLIDMAIKAKK